MHTLKPSKDNTTQNLTPETYKAQKGLVHKPGAEVGIEHISYLRSIELQPSNEAD